MIRLMNLWKSFGPLEVLKGLSLDIHQGEILVIIGRSGIGKSVLLRHILGIEKPDKGYVEIENVNISELRGQKLYHAIQDMGMLFQGAALFDSMNIFENTAFYLKQHGEPISKIKYTKKEVERRVKEALKLVELTDVEKKMPSDLSGGMKKRAALARLIVYRPKILLYDEPTTGLDPITAQHINELIVKTQNELKGTSIIVTHDIHSALYCADRIALIDNGKILYVAEPKAFLEIKDPLIRFLKETLPHHPRAEKEKTYVR
jgi:phospholipid/cholesterol/gamma-HCH transport system ATP-binding protein